MVEIIVEETQREAILNRPYNLAGSVNMVETERFNIESNSVKFGPSKVVPALIKLFMEVVDNPIDAAIKHKTCTKIDIKVDSKSIWVKDNGHGVSTKIDTVDNEYIVYKAFCKYNTSSNYTHQKGLSKGVNGIGVKLCTTLSTRFEVISEDTKGKVKIIATENNLNHDIKKMKKSKDGSTGVEIYFEPDFNIFECDEIDQEHINRMYEYTLMQALTYPDISFTFNGRQVKITPKSFLKFFGEDAVIEEQEDYFFGIIPNDMGEFKQLSYVNGLEISKGGTHINFIIDNLSKNLREKLMSKYKTIKQADIKSKLTLILVAKNMKHIDWEGQVKNNITSPLPRMKEYFDVTDLQSFTLKVYKNKNILNNIIDYFKIKDEFQKQKDLKQVSKKIKITSDKYLPSIGTQKYLFITEGDSATGACIEPLGRKECSFYSLKGKPLNAYSATTQKFTSNKELSELFSIIRNENFEYIIPATDQDLDGIHIRGLIIGFVEKYLPEYKDKIGILNTPVIVVKKGDNIVRWYYSLKDEVVIKPGETSSYYKGLGTWKVKDLEYIISKEGLDKMITILEFDDDSKEYIENWLGDDSTPRKDMILENEFSIAKI